MTSLSLFLNQDQWIDGKTSFPAECFSCFVTRFNLYYKRYWDLNQLHDSHNFDKWTSHRVGSLRLSIIAFANLSVRPDKWYILIDEHVPVSLSLLMKDIERLGLSSVIVFLLIPRDAGWMGFLDVLRPVILKDSRSYKYVLTTRLDSDDCLQRDYLKACISAIDWSLSNCIDLPLAFNFPLGLVSDGAKTVASLNDKNAFVSLFEKLSSGLITPYVAGHKHIDDHASIIDVLTREPMWLVNLHGSNIGTTHIRQGSRAGARVGGFCSMMEMKSNDLHCELFGLDLNSSGSRADVGRDEMRQKLTCKLSANPILVCSSDEVDGCISLTISIFGKVGKFLFAFHFRDLETGRLLRKVPYSASNCCVITNSDLNQCASFSVRFFVRDKDLATFSATKAFVLN